MIRVLFVCLGNICRSPSAQGVFESLIEAEGRSGVIGADSAGTAAYHIGEPPDARATAAAALRGSTRVLEETRYDFGLVRAVLDGNLSIEGSPAEDVDAAVTPHLDEPPEAEQLGLFGS